MRAFALFVFILFSGPALAENWGAYQNSRFGYAIEVPPGFIWGDEADNGDGRSFRDGATKLTVWGGHIVEDTFESAARAASSLAAEDRWTITYEAITPRWASFSGTQGKRVLYQRMIALCDGQYAVFRLEYSAVDIARLDPVVNRLVHSLEGGC